MNYDILDTIKQLYPDLPLLATEGTTARPSGQALTGTFWQHGQQYAIDIMRDLNHMTEGWIDWNMLLDYTGGPSNQDIAKKLNDLGNCNAPIRSNFTTYPYYDLDDPHGNFDLLYQPAYWHFGHIAKYLPRGSVRVSLDQQPPMAPASTDKKTSGMPTSVESTAFVVDTDINGNSKQQLVVIVSNFLPDATTYTLNVPSYGSAFIEMPAQSIQTLTLDL